MTRTAALRTAVAGAFAVTIAVAVWLLVTLPDNKVTDCTVAQQMWTLYGSRTAAARSAAQESDGGNAATAVEYQKMITELRAHADRIGTPDIRSAADGLVAINETMFEHWQRWVAESRTRSNEPAMPSSSDNQFGRQFAADARTLELVHADLAAVCPD